VSVRVSVVVPVFEPNEAFDDLIASLDRQTLPAGAFEVLLCDDGSGEATQQRLAAIAEARENVRVLYLPHTGWPGTPRNHGIAAASGEYIQFVDQDDWLYDDALEKLCDFADRHSSDVVVGREVGIGRPLPRAIFRRDIPRAVLGEDPLLELLTPHKMFRTRFLRENGIRFPDGKVRLEDHLFVMRAYFLAGTISVLASTPVYAWVKQEGSASSARIQPETYFPHLEAVLDLIDAHTEPGELRDRLLRHWFRGKILKRITGRRLLRYPEEYRTRFLDVIVPLVRRRFGPGVDTGLTLANRARATMLREDRRDDLLALAAFEAGLQCRAEVTAARWTRGGGLRLELRVAVADAAGEPVAFTGGADAPERLWQAPAALGALPESVLDAARDLRADRVALVLIEADGTERRVASERTAGADTVRLSIDPLRLFGPADPSRGGALVARVRRAGWSFDVPVTAAAGALRSAARSPLLAGRPLAPTTTSDGTVQLQRAWPAGRVRDRLGRAARRARARLSRR
jgi:poly(ribitol-phosphate) beta-N-acetylglucosaminyltransferase